MSCSFRSNQSKKLHWYHSIMQYVITTFRQVIFIDASTSSFKSELIIRSLLLGFVASFNAFRKKFDANSLDKISNSALVLIQAK